MHGGCHGHNDRTNDRKMLNSGVTRKGYFPHCSHPSSLAGPRATVANATEMERDRRERKQRSEGKSEAVVRSVFVETYQSNLLPTESVFGAFLRLSPSVSTILHPSLQPLFGSFLSLSLSWTTVDSGSPSSPVDATSSLVTDDKRRRTMKGKAFGSPTKKLANSVGHTIQHKVQNSTGTKARGTTTGVKQQEFGDSCGGHVAD
jgi:hypothetical protein